MEEARHSLLQLVVTFHSNRSFLPVRLVCVMDVQDSGLNQTFCSVGVTTLKRIVDVAGRCFITFKLWLN